MCVGALNTTSGYPEEVLGNPKRMIEWDNAHAKGRINPRARTREQHQELLRLKYFCEDNGLSTCHVIISLVRSFISGWGAIKSFSKEGQPFIVNLQQQNTFVSQIARPRRVVDPGLLSKAKRDIRGTTYRLAFESYLLLKGLRMRRSFCFQDFFEIGANHFKKIVFRLKRKGLIVAVEPRTCPRFYKLTLKCLVRLGVMEY